MHLWTPLRLEMVPFHASHTSSKLSFWETAELQIALNPELKFLINGKILHVCMAFPDWNSHIDRILKNVITQGTIQEREDASDLSDFTLSIAGLPSRNSENPSTVRVPVNSTTWIGSCRNGFPCKSGSSGEVNQVGTMPSCSPEHKKKGREELAINKQSANFYLIRSSLAIDASCL